MLTIIAIIAKIVMKKKLIKKKDVCRVENVMNVFNCFKIIPPFNDEPHDHYLALDIYRENRPTSEEVFSEIHNFTYDGLIPKQFEELPELKYNFTPITKSTTKTQKTQLYETHTQAIYKSRLLTLSNLPEPVNCSNQEGFISSRNTTGKYL
ncbi:hypothetical protein C1645_814673 [Glomus cerebriforme]|uniref:Uncharacterized protein n=1 Tax=Glomus cerebriforme TaxID=658196 RepID=A0A397THZ3_9GLOM|nr:hypothetical protein C1645_814673 [Glomus cerebriforme]